MNHRSRRILDNASDGEVSIGIIVGAAVGGLALIVIIIVVVLYLRGRNHVVDRSKAGVVGSMMALVRYFIFKEHVCSPLWYAEYAQIVQRRPWVR